MEGKTCRDCCYFRQHYIFDGQGYLWVNCGHCKKPRLKTRKPDTKACAYFVQKEGEENTGASHREQGMLNCRIDLQIPYELIRKSQSES